ncbi:MAG: hypothetical protein P1P80_02095, partial [ANME-2 cluster archaeon]|nr:hypothetical protein [ANME-2 cluster archaeon]
RKKAENERGELEGVHRLQVTIANLNSELEKRETLIKTLEAEKDRLEKSLKAEAQKSKLSDVHTKLLYQNIKIK